MTLMSAEGVSFQDLRDTLAKFKGLRTHVVGDTIVDARPSDGVALALRLGWKILCPAALMDRIGVELDEMPNDEVEQFRAFLDSVSAEDFESE